MKRDSIAVAAGLLGMILALCVMVAQAEAGDRSWITDQDGETAGYVEREPYIDGSGRTYIRDRDGDLRAVIQESGKYVAPDLSERKPTKRWGSHEDRWGSE